MLGFLTLFYNLGLNDSCSVCACRHCCRPGLLCVLAGESVQKSLPEASVRVLELSWGYDFSWLFLHLHTPVRFSHQIRSAPSWGQATHSHWKHLEIIETARIYISLSPSQSWRWKLCLSYWLLWKWDVTWSTFARSSIPRRSHMAWCQYEMFNASTKAVWSYSLATLRPSLLRLTQSL